MIAPKDFDSNKNSKIFFQTDQQIGSICPNRSVTNADNQNEFRSRMLDDYKNVEKFTENWNRNILCYSSEVEDENFEINDQNPNPSNLLDPIYSNQISGRGYHNSFCTNRDKSTKSSGSKREGKNTFL